MSVNDDNSIDFISKEKDCYYNFEKNVGKVQDSVLNLLENSFSLNKPVYDENIDLNNDDELQIIIERNKQLRHEIDKKLEDLGKQQNQYAIYKREQKILSDEIKERHEAFLMAKKAYKRILKMYITIESRNKENLIVFIQFFTESKKDTDNYSVNLQRNTISGHYELISTVPKLNLLKEYQRRLQETNDVPGVLCCIRQEFMTMKGKKKIEK